MNVTHRAQRTILKQLLCHPKARFRDLNKTDLTNDHFTFHLRRLLELGIVQKKGIYYQLSLEGLEIAGRLDPYSAQLVQSAKVGVCLFITQEYNGRPQILLQERLHDPFKGKIGVCTEKVKKGETLQKAAQRCLKQETGYRGEFAYAGVIHIIKYTEEVLILDVFLHHFRVTGCTGTFLAKSVRSRNFWVDSEKAFTMENTFEYYTKDLSRLLSEETFFEERVFHS